MTNGNNSTVWQTLMVRAFAAAFASATNRGMVRVLEAAAALAAVNAGGVGAKLMLTVILPTGGVFCATLEVYEMYTANLKSSLAFGFVLTTSQVAVALPPVVAP